MPKFRNITADAVHVGSTDGPLVDKDQTHEVFGDVEEIDDAYLVTGGEVVVGTTEDDDGRLTLVKEREVRAWPKSVWRLVGGKPKSDDDGSSK